MPTTITNPLTRMRYMIARSDSWRTWCGITSGSEEVKLAAALARVFPLYADLDDITAYPVALVRFGDDSGKRVGESGGCFTRDYSLFVDFLDDHTDKTDTALAVSLLTFADNATSVLSNVLVLSGASTGLYFETYRRTQSPVALETSSREAWLKTSYEFRGLRWGQEDV